MCIEHTDRRNIIRQLYNQTADLKMKHWHLKHKQTYVKSSTQFIDIHVFKTSDSKQRDLLKSVTLKPIDIEIID